VKLLILLLYAIMALVVNLLGVETLLEAMGRVGPQCPVLRFTGWQCSFCGMTRAFLHLFAGQIPEALRFNWLCLPVFVGIPGVACWGMKRPIWAAGGLAILFGYALARNLIPGVT
jgi:hypothetical protein